MHIKNMVKIYRENSHKVISIFGLKFKIRKNEISLCALSDRVAALENAVYDIQNRQFMQILDNLTNNANNIYHLSAFSLLYNAGDNILVSAMQELIRQNTPFDFQFINKNCRAIIDDRDIYFFNNSNGIIIGGGGLFLKDTNPNDISGWQVPISVEQLNKIKVPVSILGVGYNRFRGQEDFSNCLSANLEVLVEKSVFFGLRNNGSIRAIKKYLPKHLHYKLKFHPCTTTILNKIYNIPKIAKEKFIAVNCAFDRAYMRFGNRQDEILSSIARVLKSISNQIKIKYYVHCDSDVEAEKYFNNLGVEFEIVYLNKAMTTRQIIEAYSSPTLVIGMRGHSQMIPFGCTTPILSIITHDKLGWFLEDIEHKEWGIDVLDKDFETKLHTKIMDMLENTDLIKEQIKKAQDDLYQLSVNNIQQLMRYYNTSPEKEIVIGINGSSNK